MKFQTRSEIIRRLRMFLSHENPEEPIWYETILRASLSIVLATYSFYTLNLLLGFPVTTSTSYLFIVLLFLLPTVHYLLAKREKHKVKLSVNTILKLCFVIGIISIPAAILSLELSRHSLLPGGDPAFFIWQARFIERNNSVLTPWGAFPDLAIAVYPPFFGILLSFTNSLTGLDIFSCTRIILVSFIFLGGLLYYAFAKKIFPKDHCVPLLILFLIMANIGLEIQITVEGSYGETMLALFLFPLLLNTLHSRRFVSSGLVLASLLGTHGFSLIIVPSIIIAFILESLLARDSSQFRGIMMTFAIFVLFALPFFPLYQQYSAVIGTGQGASFQNVPPDSYPALIGDFLFYGGLASGVFLVLCTRKGRLVGLLLFSQILITRLAGSVTYEGRLIAYLAPIFAMAFAMTSATVILHIRRFRLDSSLKQHKKKLLGIVEVGILILALSEPVMFGLPQLVQLSTLPSSYENPTRIDAYGWLSKNTVPNDKVLVLQFSDPYAKAFANCIVYSIVNTNLSSSLSASDARINNDLANALLTINMSLLREYGVTYIVVSTPPDPSIGYWPEGEPQFIRLVYDLSAYYGTISYVSESNMDVTTVYKVG